MVIVPLHCCPNSCRDQMAKATPHAVMTNPITVTANVSGKKRCPRKPTEKMGTNTSANEPIHRAKWMTRDRIGSARSARLTEAAAFPQYKNSAHHMSKLSVSGV